jgi:hypothetical protein
MNIATENGNPEVSTVDALPAEQTPSEPIQAPEVETPQVTLIERARAWFDSVVAPLIKVRNLFVAPTPTGSALTGYALLVAGAFVGGTAVFLMLDSQHDTFRRQAYAQQTMLTESLVVREGQLKGVSSELADTKERVKFWQDRFDILTTNYHALAYPQGTASNVVVSVVSTNKHWWSRR